MYTHWSNKIQWNKVLVHLFFFKQLFLNFFFLSQLSRRFYLFLFTSAGLVNREVVVFASFISKHHCFQKKANKLKVIQRRATKIIEGVRSGWLMKNDLSRWMSLAWQRGQDNIPQHWHEEGERNYTVQQTGFYLGVMGWYCKRTFSVEQCPKGCGWSLVIWVIWRWRWQNTHKKGNYHVCSPLSPVSVLL